MEGCMINFSQFFKCATRAMLVNLEGSRSVRWYMHFNSIATFARLWQLYLDL